MTTLAGRRSSELQIAIVIATLGRPESVAQLLGRLAGQSKLPSQVVLSVESDADLPPLAAHPFEVGVVLGPRGLPAQRNRGIERVKPDSDLLVFYDDDFVPSRRALADMASFFVEHPDVVGAQGHVLADGAVGPGISYAEAVRIVDHADKARTLTDLSIGRDIHGLYGCNMAYVYGAVHNVHFDEQLPLYAWFEDLDFSARVGRRIVTTKAFQGVHRGDKGSRERGMRVGYSQLANPIYMARKGTLSWRICIRSIARLMLANHAHLPRPEPWMDRKGRAAGNWRAIGDLLRGRIHPQRIIEL